MKILCFNFILWIPGLLYNQTQYLVYFKPKDTLESKIAISEEAIKRRVKYRIALDAKDYSIEHSRLRSIENIVPIKKGSRWLNAVLIVPKSSDLERIKKLSFVDRVEVLANYESKYKSTQQKLESNYTKEQYGSAFKQIDLHKGQRLHDEGYEGQGMKIAVFDAGFVGVDKIQSFAHLFSDKRIHPISNIVENTKNVFTLDGHGTAVLGCMAAFVKDTIVASAPKANYYLFITEDPRSETRVEELNWAIAAEMADSIGVDLINSSLGYHQFDDPSQNYQREDMDGKTTIVSKAAAIAADKGIIVVNSAGNHGNKEWGIITAPADVDGVVTVGALDLESNLAEFSSKGFYKYHTIKPNIVGVGKGTTLYYDSGDYYSGNGTSFSSPLLAGLIACFWQKNSFLNPTELRSILYSLGSNYLTPNREIGFGFPLFDSKIELERIKFKERMLSVYPNPSNGNTILEVSSNEYYKNAKLDVYYGGKIIYKTDVNIHKGVNHIFINTEDYPKGLYFFKLTLDNYSLEERYLKN